ncbi:MAG TPA: M12 family metallopeptidase [Phycisphaerales bacterium]|nr:M12 family metallopeptidase [Phycisphaerales bacterium]
MPVQPCRRLIAGAYLMSAVLLTLCLGAQAWGQPALPPEIAQRERRGCIQHVPTAPGGAKSLWMTNLWTGGVIPYVFDANTTPAQHAAMREAMNTLEGVANLHFVPRTGQANYLTIRDSTGNNSHVGMIGGAQTVNVFNWNFRFVMVHELMHALGVQHEQSRPDRGQYVTINTGNIAVDAGQCGGSCSHNFDIIQGAVHGAYDFDSVMHYGQNAFSVNGQPTITVLPPNQAWQPLIGQLTHLSAGDIAGLVSRYGAVPSAPWTQRTVSGPSARDGHALVYDSFRNRAVLFGGMTSSGRSAETWEWNGTAWTQRVVTGPSSRHLHAMAYDSVRRVTVLFGGSTSSTYTNETWEWNGTAWAQRAVAGPSARNMHAMAYDAVRGVTVLYGGATSSSGRSAETWEWNGTSWTQRNAPGPTGRAAHALAYDARRGVCVLTGGQAAGGAFPGDTWEWDGFAWTQRATSGPSGRYQTAMAYDPVRAVTALYGGWNGASISSENWDWSGTAWLQRAGASPSGRYNHAMAHDTVRGVTVLFGGVTAAGRNAETWELGTPCASPTISSHPTNQAGCSNFFTATFSVTAASTGAVTYQWRKGGATIADVAGHRSGCTTPTLTITQANTSDAGTYDCIVTSVCGSTTSNAAVLTANTSPTPVSASANPPSICVGQSSTLSAAAVGNPLIRWYNAATNTLVTSPVSPSVTTTYYAVSNPFSCPSNRSQLVTVTVGTAPSAPTAVLPGSPAETSYCTPPSSITLQAVGGSGGTTSWRKSEGSPDGCGSASITGGANGTLVVTPAPAVTTTYYARTVGACGESACASITINVGCSADLGGTGGVAVADCSLDNNDFVVFIDYFFVGDPRADRGSTGGQPGGDGVFDNNDFVVFIDQFFGGCP